MAIRDKFRRAVGSSSHKSTTSLSSSSSTHATETASTADSESSSSSSPSSSVADRKSRTRVFAWRPAKPAHDKEQEQKQQKKKNKNKTYSDPREKPFSEMNLRYQEILGSFELTFGTSHPEQLWNPDGELSPGTSRQNSIDLGRN